jgi:hypothetical protein
MSGCDKEVVGGFQATIDAGDHNDPHHELLGLKTCWCKLHEAMLRPGVAGKRGRWMSPKQLAD